MAHSETTGQREKEHHLNDSADASELGVGTSNDGAVMADGAQFRLDPLVPAGCSCGGRSFPSSTVSDGVANRDPYVGLFPRRPPGAGREVLGLVTLSWVAE